MNHIKQLFNQDYSHIKLTVEELTQDLSRLFDLMLREIPMISNPNDYSPVYSEMTERTVDLYKLMYPSDTIIEFENDLKEFIKIVKLSHIERSSNNMATVHTCGELNLLLLSYINLTKSNQKTIKLGNTPIDKQTYQKGQLIKLIAYCIICVEVVAISDCPETSYNKASNY